MIFFLALILGITARSQEVASRKSLEDVFADSETESCIYRCGVGNTDPSSVVCSCDRACIFLGDCCYDYVLTCQNKDENKNFAEQKGIFDGIQEQADGYILYGSYSSCNTNAVSVMEHQNNTLQVKSLSLYMVDRCPTTARQSTKSGCTKSHQPISGFPSQSIPVIWKGVLFSNIYCAQCHDVPLHEVHPTGAYYACKIRPDSEQPIVETWAEKYKECNKSDIVISSTVFVNLARYHPKCKQADHLSKFPVSECRNPDLKVQCLGYIAWRTLWDKASSKHLLFRNGACAMCISAYKDHIRQCIALLSFPSLQPLLNHTRLVAGHKLDIDELYTTDATCMPKDQNCDRKLCPKNKVSVRINLTRTCVPFEDKYIFRVEHSHPFKPSVDLLSPAVLFFSNHKTDMLNLLTKHRIIGEATLNSSTKYYRVCPTYVHGLYGPLITHNYQYTTSKRRYTPRKWSPLPWEERECIIIYIDPYEIWSILQTISSKSILAILKANPSVHVRLLNHDPLSGPTCPQDTVPLIIGGINPRMIAGKMSSRVHWGFLPRDRNDFFRLDRNGFLIQVLLKAVHSSLELRSWLPVCTPTNMTLAITADHHPHGVTYYLPFSRRDCHSLGVATVPQATQEDSPAAFMCHNTTWGGIFLTHVTAYGNKFANAENTTGTYFCETETVRILKLSIINIQSLVKKCEKYVMGILFAYQVF